jgi:hypothetical protein
LQISLPLNTMILFVAKGSFQQDPYERLEEIAGGRNVSLA